MRANNLPRGVPAPWFRGEHAVGDRTDRSAGSPSPLTPRRVRGGQERGGGRGGGRLLASLI